MAANWWWFLSFSWQITPLFCILILLCPFVFSTTFLYSFLVLITSLYSKFPFLSSIIRSIHLVFWFFLGVFLAGRQVVMFRIPVSISLEPSFWVQLRASYFFHVPVSFLSFPGFSSFWAPTLASLFVTKSTHLVFHLPLDRSSNIGIKTVPDGKRTRSVR